MSKGVNLLISLIIVSYVGLFSVTIDNIIIEGNELIDSKQIFQKINFNEGDSLDVVLVNKAPSRILELYQKNEIYFVNIETPKIIPLSAKEVNIEIDINEYVLNNISGYNFNGNFAVKSSILESLLSSKKYTTNDINTIKKTILQEYLNRGYFFTQVNIDTIQEKEDGALISFRILENKPFRHLYTDYVGNNVSRPKVLDKIARFDRSKAITPDLLNTYQNRFLAKTYISDCKIYPIDYETLRVELVESSMTRFSGIAGYNSANEEDPITGFVSLEFMNLSGTDRSIDFKWNQLQASKRIIQLSYHDSGLMEYDFSSDLDINRIEYDTLANQTSLSLALNYDYQAHSFAALYGYSSYDVTSSVSEETSETINSIGLRWNHNSYDRLYNPLSGHDVLISFKYNKSSLDSSGYNTTESTIGLVSAVSNKLVVFNRLSLNYSTKSNLNNHVEFKLGGFASLRGFQQEQFSGFFTILSNSELRYIFGQKNNIFIFGDCAYLEYERNDVKTRKGHLYSTGIGLRLSTKLGMLTFEYGLGYNEKWNNLSDGLIHFGLETSF